jgi:hypothetical protein
MATKPRAAKAPAPVAATRRAASSTPKSPSNNVAVKSRKTAAKPAAKSTARPAVKTAAKVAVKDALKPAVKAAVKAVPKAPAKAAARRGAANVPVALKRAAKAVAAVQPASGNPALVRDSFTMPEAEYAVFANAKQRCLQAGVEIKKSELLRIGIALVGQLDVATLQAVLAGLPQLKTGRPRSEG